MEILRIKEILSLNPEEQEIIARGWIRTKRDSKKVTFMELNDGSCFSNIQIIAEKTGQEITSKLEQITTGSSARIKGKLVESPGKGQNVEIHATEVEIIGEAPAEEYPLQKKRHSFEFLREIAHLRPRTNTFGAIARVRNAMSYAIHTYFQENGFLYIHTPIITGSDCEGAGEMFQVTTLPLLDTPTCEGAVDYSQDFFSKQTSLTVSGQLNAEIYACALSNVYTFGPTFRAENSNTSRHLAEFWMVEPEIAFCDIHGNMDVAENFLKYIFSYILENCREDMEFFDKRIQNGLIDNLTHVIESKFERITYTEAVKQLEKTERKFEFPVSWGVELQSEHEKYLTEEVYKRPVIIIDYPKDIKAFYMKQNEDNKTVRAMDVLVPRLGEIIGGSQREEDYKTLKNRIEELGLDASDYWGYLELRKFGTVPHSGFGLGFERLIQYVTGMQNIRDVIPFPRAVNSAEF